MATNKGAAAHGGNKTNCSHLTKQEALGLMVTSPAQAEGSSRQQGQARKGRPGVSRQAAGQPSKAATDLA